MTPPLIVGNWKMNGLGRDLAEARGVAAGIGGHGARVALCPPATLLSRMAEALAATPVLVGGQDCRAEASGAFTGDVSAEMLADCGVKLVIVGHSERRADYGESDELVAAKAMAARRAGLEPVVCVGETRAERDAGRTLEVIRRQIEGSIAPALADAAFAVAYEPVWAIGAGVTPTDNEIAEAHATLRRALVERVGERGGSTPILYGGSVKPDNAAQILKIAEVGGALVGGASLRAADFLAIIGAAPSL